MARKIQHLLAGALLFLAGGAAAQTPGIKIRDLPVCTSPAAGDKLAIATVGGSTCAASRSDFVSTVLSEPQGYVFAGPCAGGAGTALWRALCAADLPAATTGAAGAVKLARDLGGTGPLPNVVGLQGRDMDSAAPSNLWLLQYLTSTSKWTPVAVNYAGSASIGGPAATALALNATPSLCGAGLSPLGILANGNATGCFTPATSVTFTPASLFSVSGSPGASITESWQALAANTIVANNTGGSAAPTAVPQSSILHNSFGGLTTGDPHTQYPLLNGRSGGQALTGGINASEFLALKGSSNAASGGVFVWQGDNFTVQSSNGANWTHGQASELLTFNATPKDTTASLLPANAVIRAVVIRVVSSLAGSCSAFSVGDPTTAARFAAGVATTSGTTTSGLTHVDQTGAAGPKQATAATVRLTCASGTPSGGTVRITVYYDQFTAPTS